LGIMNSTFLILSLPKGGGEWRKTFKIVHIKILNLLRKISS
jgi:hypothetical protein